jgi:glycosyltransferase involved in cell wall biosynthesis
MNISLVIRTLNEEENIANCLSAVLAQTKQPREVIVADNMSTDHTLEVVKEFESKLPIRILMNPIIGFSSGLNIGTKESKYDYVAFLSADCIPEKNWLFELSEFMTNKGCAITQGVEILYPENIIHHVLRAEESYPVTPQKITYFNYTNTLNDKNILKKFLPFEDVGKYLYGEDTLMAINYKNNDYDAFIVPNAKVKHKKFGSIAEFEERVYKHSRSSVSFFLKVPLRPRIYLNSFYWILKEFELAIVKHDARFIKVSYWRLKATIKGTSAGLIDIIRQ